MEEKQEKEEKKEIPELPEKTPEEIRNETHENLMDTIIAETFARHSKLSEEEFLENIGFKDSGKTEEEAIRIAKLNVLMALTKGVLAVEGKLNMANNLFRHFMLEEGLAQENKSKKEDKGE